MTGTIEETLLYQFTKFSLGFLKIPGLWLHSRFCRLLVASIFVTINSILLLAQLIELKRSPSNVEITVPLMLRLIVSISIYLKAIVIVRNKVEIQELHFTWDNVQGLREYMKRFHREVKVVHIIYGIFMFFTGILWLVRPSFIKQQYRIKPHDGQPRLPLGGWYPFDLNSPIKYSVTIVLQVSTMILCGFCSHGCNLLFLMTAMFISKLLTFLNYQLALVPKSKNIKQRIRELGMFQEEIFKFTKKADKLFTFIAYIYLAKIISLFLIAAFKATSPGVELRDTIFHLQIIYSQLFFFYLVTRYAGEIVNETYNVLDTTFNWPWEDWPLDVQRQMQALRATSLQPAALTAGIYTLNGEFFLRGIGIAMSSFMLLHNIRNSFKI